jgi:hypothetical protein
MESEANGSLYYAKQCSGEGEENLRLLKKHVDAIVAKAENAHAILERHHDLIGWDESDPNQGLARAQNAVCFLQAASVGLADLAGHFEHNKERHLGVVELGRKKVDRLFDQYADLLATPA